MKFKIVAILIYRGYFNQEKSMMVGQLTVIAARLCPTFHVGTKMQTKEFWILAKIHFSARTTNKIHLESLGMSRLPDSPYSLTFPSGTFPENKITFNPYWPDVLWLTRVCPEF